MPMLMPVIKPLNSSTVAEPLPAAMEYVISPPRPNVAVVVTLAVNVPSTFKLLAEVIVNTGVVLPIVINCEMLAP